MPPRIPHYNRQVSRSGLPGVRASGRDHVSQARQQTAGIRAQGGRALEGVGQQVASAFAEQSEYAAKVRDEQEKAQLAKAYAEGARAKRSLLEDTNNGFLLMQGENALAERASVGTAYRAVLDQVRDGLPGDRAKKAFQQDYDRLLDGFETAADRHVSEQSIKLAEQATEAALSAATDDALSAARQRNYDLAQVAIGDGVLHLKERAKTLGWGSEATARAVRQFETKAHLGILDGMVDGSRITDARDYLEKVRDTLDEEMVAKSNIEKTINGALRMDDARNIADRLYSQAGGDPQKALAELEKMGIEDSAKRYEARRNILGRDNERRAMEDGHDRPLLDVLDLRMREGGGTGFQSKEYRKLNTGGKAQWRKMVLAEHRASRSARAELNRYQAELDRNAEADFRGRPVEERLGLDVDATYPDATKRQRDLIRERLNKDKEASSKASPMQTKAFESLIRERAERAQLRGIVGTKIEKGSDADVFLADMRDQFFAFMVENDRPPSPAETKAMAAEALAFGEIAGSGIIDEKDTRRFKARRQGKEFNDADFEQENRDLLVQLGHDPAELGAPPSSTEPPAAPTPAPPPRVPAGMVPVMLKDGTRRGVPSDRVADYLKAHEGSRVIQ